MTDLSREKVKGEIRRIMTRFANDHSLESEGYLATTKFANYLMQAIESGELNATDGIERWVAGYRKPSDD